MRPLLLLLLACAAIPACKKKSDAPDCKAAASTYATLVKQQIDRDNKDDEAKRAQALSLIPSLKEEMAKACEKNGWTAATRTCIRDAKDAADLPRCMPKKEAPAEPGAAPATPAEGGKSPG